MKLFSLFFAAVFFIPAGLYARTTLTLPKGTGYAAAKLSYSAGNDFYDGTGSRKDSSTLGFIDGTREQFYESMLTLRGEYGLTDKVTLWINFPFSYRKETIGLNARDWGIGDLSAGVLAEFVTRSPFHLAAELAGTFPSGGTDVAFGDSTRGRQLHLPLGTGSPIITPGLQSSFDVGHQAALQISGSYSFRLKARVEYLASPLVPQASTDGSTSANLPVGNLEINWGDEIRGAFRAVYQFHIPVEVSFSGNYLYRRPTTVDNFVFVVNSGLLTDSTVSPLTLPSAQYASVTPHIEWKVQPSLDLAAEVEIPLWGKNFPTLPLVESLIGNHYSIEVRYVF